MALHDSAGRWGSSTSVWLDPKPRARLLAAGAGFRGDAADTAKLVWVLEVLC